MLDVRALFLGGAADRADHTADAIHAGDDFLCAGAGVQHQLHAIVDLLHRVADQLFDLLGGLGRAMAIEPILPRHHREVPALLACAPLNRRVQCQDVGLENYALDDADDVDDLAGWCRCPTSTKAAKAKLWTVLLSIVITQEGGHRHGGALCLPNL